MLIEATTNNSSFFAELRSSPDIEKTPVGYYWRGKVIFQISEFEGVVEVDRVKALKQGQGDGTEAMEWLTELADKHHVKLSLNPVPLGEQKMPKAELANWYRRFGFKHTKLDDPKEPETMIRMPKNRKVSAVRYEDLYPESFVEFRKKYLKTLKERRGSWTFVQFTNFADDVLRRNPHEDPDHHDPVGVYGYPLKYVLKHPADVWYGTSARYLRVLEMADNAKILQLQYLEDFEVKAILVKMGFKDPWKLMEAAGKLYAPRIGKGSTSIGKLFMSVLQKEVESVGNIPAKKKDALALGETVKDRPQIEQTRLLRKAGYDAVLDSATNAKKAVINGREPEQVIFLHRYAFKVVEVIPLRAASQPVAEKRDAKDLSTKVGTSQSELRDALFRKAAAIMAAAIGDKLASDKDKPSAWYKLFWTVGGREIEVTIERPASYYENKQLGEKKHKEVTLSSPDTLRIELNSERGKFSYSSARGGTIRQIADEIAADFRKATPKEGWTPLSLELRVKQREEQREAAYKREKEGKQALAVKEVDSYIKNMAYVASKLDVPFDPAPWIASAEMKQALDSEVAIAIRSVRNKLAILRAMSVENREAAFSVLMDTAVPDMYASVEYKNDDLGLTPEQLHQPIDVIVAAAKEAVRVKRSDYLAGYPASFFENILNEVLDYEPAE